MPDAVKSKQALARALRQIRDREEITQEDLAHRANVHVTWVSRMESGKKDPRWTSLQALAAGLGVTAMEIVALAERLELD
jgi:transcriptional regulator with XRE-family HTH domain